MKKLFICGLLLAVLSGCDENMKEMTCSSSTNANGVITKTSYDIKYDGDEVKKVIITYDYTDNQTNDVDGTQADTSGLTRNNNDDGVVTSDDIVDGAVGDAIDTGVNTVKDTILGLSGLKQSMDLTMYDNIDGLTYKVDVDNDREYKVIYEVDMDKIGDNDLSLFNISRDFSDIKDNYESYGYTCE